MSDETWKRRRYQAPDDVMREQLADDLVTIIARIDTRNWESVDELREALSVLLQWEPRKFENQWVITTRIGEWGEQSWSRYPNAVQECTERNRVLAERIAAAVLAMPRAVEISDV